MTTRGEAPVLDRLITRRVEGPSPGHDPFGQALPGDISTVMVWASRRDFQARDFLNNTTAGLIAVKDSCYTVRAETGPWSEVTPSSMKRGVLAL